MAKYYFDPQNEYFDRDCPINLEWSAPGMAEAFGLPSAPDAGYEAMRDMMLANLWLAAEGGRALSYSRHIPFYKRSRYRPADFTYTTIMRVVAEIVEAEIAREDRTKPGHRGRQSTLTATPALYKPDVVQDDLIYQPGEAIILRSRDEDRALIPYDETLRTRRMKSEVAAVREMHASTVIGVSATVVQRNGRAGTAALGPHFKVANVWLGSCDHPGWGTGCARPLPVPSYNFFLGPNNNMKEKT